MTTKYTTTMLENRAIDMDDLFIRKALFSDAGLWGWGDGQQGLLGDNTITNKSSPVQTISAGTNWKLVASGGYHTAAIKTDGTLWLWGANGSGQLGNNAVAQLLSPVQTISGGTNWKQVECGYNHTAAIKTDGTLWLWGLASDGQLGTNDRVHRSSPVQTVAGGTNWKSVKGGAFFSAAIKTDGTLWLWGYCFTGQLGDNTTVAKSSPVQTVAGGTNWKEISCGNYQTVAIKTDGTLWLWGNNYQGLLGTEDTVHRSSPVQTVAAGTNWKQAAIGNQHTAAIKTDGTLWVWGYNFYGSLGDNTSGAGTNKSSPVQTISGGTNWKQVAIGATHTAAIKTDGTLWLWGFGQSGSLGTNNAVLYSSPVQTVAGGTNWKSVNIKKSTTWGLREDYW